MAPPVIEVVTVFAGEHSYRLLRSHYMSNAFRHTNVGTCPFGSSLSKQTEILKISVRADSVRTVHTQSSGRTEVKLHLDPDRVRQ